MDFIDAMINMKHRRKSVRRPIWPADQRTQIAEENGVSSSSISVLNEQQSDTWVPFPSDLMATDWEIYQPE